MFPGRQGLAHAAMGPTSIFNSLTALKLALPAIGNRVAGSLPSSPLRSLFTSALPKILLATISETTKQIERHHETAKVLKTALKKAVQDPAKRPIIQQIRRLSQSHRHQPLHQIDGSIDGTRTRVGMGLPHRSVPIHEVQSQGFRSTTPTRSKFRSNQQPLSQTHSIPSLTSRTHDLSKRNGPQTTLLSHSQTGPTPHKLQITPRRSFSTHTALTPRSTRFASRLGSSTSPQVVTTAKRYSKFRFKRYSERTRWSPFHHFTDIFSPLQTLTQMLRPLRYKLDKFLPGRFAGYFAYILTGVSYTWILILLLERNRQFDSGWVNPEAANFGYFTKRDWAMAAPMYDVEIFRKRKRYKKQDGNRFLHEEDLKIENLRPKRWKWMHHDNIDRFGRARGIWPLRSYVINSPQYVDRRYLSRGYNHRRHKFGKWIKAFGDKRNTARQKKRALRMRGGKYEYGGTAHQYWFTQTLDESRFMKSPTSEIPKYAKAASRAGKY